MEHVTTQCIFGRFRCPNIVQFAFKRVIRVLSSYHCHVFLFRTYPFWFFAWSPSSKSFLLGVPFQNLSPRKILGLHPWATVFESCRLWKDMQCPGGTSRQLLPAFLVRPVVLTMFGFPVSGVLAGVNCYLLSVRFLECTAMVFPYCSKASRSTTKKKCGMESRPQHEWQKDACHVVKNLEILLKTNLLKGGVSCEKNDVRCGELGKTQ